MKNTIIALALSLTAAVVAFSGCTKEGEGPDAEVTEGVVFEFSMHKVYELNLDSIDEIAAVKITLVKDGEKIVLPTMTVSGDAEFVQTEPYALEPGEYRMTNYKAYADDASFIFEADVDDDNVFVVSADEITHFPIPIAVKILNFPTNYLKNIFSGFCQEVWGDDESLWPWDFDDDIANWDYLEFEYDDYGNPTALVGLTFVGSYTVLNEDQTVEIRKETPFLTMTKIPDCINRIETLSNITILDLPNLKELPKDIYRLRYFDGLIIQNAGIEHFPEGFFETEEMATLVITDTPLKELPKDVENFEKLTSLVIRNTDITSIDINMSKLPVLGHVDFSHNESLTSINDNIFEGSAVNNLTLAGDAALASIPSSIASSTTLRGLDLSGCGLTSFPDAAKNKYLMSLYLDDNGLTSVIPLDGFPQIETLTMNGNPLSGTPSVSSSTLKMLELSGCGLTAMPDVSKCPELGILYLNDNAYTSISEIDFATSNQKLKMLSLAGNAGLVSLPSEASFKIKMAEDGSVETFSALNLNDCPALKWTVPASWKPYDLPKLWDQDNPEYAKVGEEDAASTKAAFDPAEWNWKGRVGIWRYGSSGVTF